MEYIVPLRRSLESKGEDMKLHDLPDFNLVANVWHWPNNPIAGPADCQCPSALRVDTTATRSTFVIGSANFSLCRIIYQLKGNDLRPSWPNTGRGDIVEIPESSGRFYVCWDVDDVAKGHANEFRVGVLIPTTAFGGWPQPMP